MVRRLSKTGNITHQYSNQKSPIISIKPGERLIVETEDAFNGLLQSPGEVEMLVGPATLPPNPVTGPIFIEGAKSGDILVVNIEKISLGSQGGTCFARLDHPIKNWFDGNFAKVYPIKNNVIEFSSKLHMKAEPFIGCIATAPQHYSPASTQVFRSGGNMDCCQIKQGSKVYLPINCDGGYLYLGDVHALQADGEFCGTAVETSAQVTLHVDLISNKSASPLNWPRIETDNALVTIATGSCSEEAYVIAMGEMINWLKTDYGFSPKETFLQLCQFANLRPCNWFTVRCELPREFLSL